MSTRSWSWSRALAWRGCFGLATLSASLLTSPPALAQAPDGQRHIARLVATPIGALPPIAMPMPASRNHNYWGFRLQAGYTRRPDEPDLTSYAGGIDFQRQGGSVFGLTAGYQARECEPSGQNCHDHVFFGARARFNVITGGPTVAALISDYSASTALGAEIGFGYASGVTSVQTACALDVGVPISVAMFQIVRVVPFISPGLAWDVGCGGAGRSIGASFLTAAGVGVQQLFHRGLDVHVGLQRIFRQGTGVQLGISATYVRLP